MMSEAVIDASAADEAPNKGKKAKKKGGKKKLVLLLAALGLAGGGGGGFAYYTMAGATGAEEDPHADDPELVVREGVSERRVEAARQRARNGSPDPHIFQSTYVPLEGNFTSNLQGGDAFVQIGLGLSTYYDEHVVENIHRHEMAIRSAILMTLSEADPVEITSLRGKEALKNQLKNAINNVLTNREGFGGIDDVYFTSFVTQ
jgi:flagellar FliL protein